MELNLKKFIEELKSVASEQKKPIYITGGYIRDKLMDVNSAPKDIDIIYSGDIYYLIDSLKNKGYKFYPVKEEEGIYSTIISGYSADISIMKGSTIEEDLARRDFTVNAIALSLLDKKVIDIFNGRRAIKSRILQEVDETSLKSDPVRILRGMRFYIKYGLHFSIGTEAHVTEFAHLLREAKGERVLNEMLSIIQCDTDGRAFELMDNYRIIENILPYINELKDIEKGDFKCLDVFSHMDLTYKSYKELLSGLIVLKDVDLSFLEKQTGNHTLREYQGFACFVHDMGKYLTIDEHSVAGAEILEKKCLELKFPREAADIVTSAVRYHEVPRSLYEISDEGQLLSHLYLFFKQNGSTTPFILLTSFCDVYAEKIIYDPANEKKKFKEFIEKLFTLYNRYISIIRNKWVDGDFIQKETQINGREIGILIDEINELIFSGIVNSKEEAQKYIMTKYGG